MLEMCLYQVTNSIRRGIMFGMGGRTTMLFQKGSFFFGDLSPGHVTFLEQVPDPPNNT